MFVVKYRATPWKSFGEGTSRSVSFYYQLLLLGEVQSIKSSEKRFAPLLGVSAWEFLRPCRHKHGKSVIPSSNYQSERIPFVWSKVFPPSQETHLVTSLSLCSLFSANTTPSIGFMSEIHHTVRGLWLWERHPGRVYPSRKVIQSTHPHTSRWIAIPMENRDSGRQQQPPAARVMKAKGPRVNCIQSEAATIKQRWMESSIRIFPVESIFPLWQRCWSGSWRTLRVMLRVVTTEIQRDQKCFKNLTTPQSNCRIPWTVAVLTRY